MPFSHNKFYLKSVNNKLLYLQPLYFILFIDLFAAFAFSPGEKETQYHYISFFLFLTGSGVVYILMMFSIFRKHQSLEINDGKVILRPMFSSKTTSYNLADIIDFKWNNKPEHRSFRAGSYSLIKNEIIQIYFKNDTGIEIDFTAYGNFTEIKQFFYDYCIENKIISIPSLEQRKYGTKRKNQNN